MSMIGSGKRKRCPVIGGTETIFKRIGKIIIIIIWVRGWGGGMYNYKSQCGIVGICVQFSTYFYIPTTCLNFSSLLFWCKYCFFLSYARYFCRFDASYR